MAKYETSEGSQLYGFMTAASRAGFEVLLRDPSDDTASRVVISYGEDTAPEARPTDGVH
jgi:hypothetical protein